MAAQRANPIQVLMLLHFFPPLEPMAAQRARRLVRHLSALGIEPTVVTGRSPAAADQRSESGEVERTEIVDGTPVRVIRVRGWEPLAWYQRQRARRTAGAATDGVRTGRAWKRFIRSWIVPDEQLFLIPAWVRAGLRSAQHGCDVVYSSSAPYSAHLAARRLADRLGCPLVIEMRDLWSDNRYLPPFANPLARALQRHLERSCLQRASRLVVLSAAHAEHLRRQYPRLAGRVRVVPNAFDPVPGATQRRLTTGTELRVFFAGLLYGGRSLAALGRAVDTASGDLPGFAAALLEVAGKSYAGPWAEVLGGLGPRRRVHGLVPQDRIQTLLREVHAGVVNNPPWDEVHIPGKLYEYIGAGLPILNLSTQPEIAEICRGLVPCWQIHPDDEPGMVDALRELAQWWVANPAGATLPGADHPLSSISVARRLASVLAEVVT